MMEEVDRIKKLLEKLDELKRSGVLSEEEFESKKQILMKRLENLQRPESSYRPSLTSRHIWRLSLSLLAVVLIIIGIVTAITPSWIPVSHSTTILTSVTTEGPTVLNVPILEKSSAKLNINEILYIWIDKYYLKRLPASSTLIPPPITMTKPMTTITAENPLTVIVTERVQPTTTISFGLTELRILYNDKEYRLLEEEPMIIGRIAVDKGPVDFIILDDENFIKFFQHVTYEPVYSMANIIGTSEFKFKLPRDSKISGNKVYFIFMNRGSEETQITYQVDASWNVIEKGIVTTYAPTYVTSYYKGAPLTETGLSIILVGAILLVLAFWARRFNF
jgi:hypothetical protein